MTDSHKDCAPGPFPTPAWETAIRNEVGKHFIADHLRRNRTLDGYDNGPADALGEIVVLLARAECDEWISVIADLIDDDDCRLDHHGYCQTHAWMHDTREYQCPHARAKELAQRG